MGTVQKAQFAVARELWSTLARASGDCGGSRKLRAGVSRRGSLGQAELRLKLFPPRCAEQWQLVCARGTRTRNPLDLWEAVAVSREES